MTDEDQRPAGRLQKESHMKGRIAREKKQPRTAPEYARRSLTSAWLAGWDERDRELAPAVQVRDPAPVSRDPAPVTPGSVWPADQPLPTVYVRRSVPCLRCRRVLLAHGGRAVKVRTVQDGFAYFRCDACAAQFKLRMA